MIEGEEELGWVVTVNLKGASGEAETVEERERVLRIARLKKFRNISKGDISSNKTIVR
jgi:hypothetical protein